MSQTVARVALVWFSSTLLRMPRLRFVSHLCAIHSSHRNADPVPAKFTGYQYGGRPLGLTFVKYMNPDNGDPMEGNDGALGMTQDQIM